MWIITNDDRNYTLSTIAGTLQYNSSSPRFTTYTSSQNPAVLYYRTKTGPAMGIKSVKQVKKNGKRIYNLRGQQVKTSRLPKGLYIRNSKKFVVK